MHVTIRLICGFATVMSLAQCVSYGYRGAPPGAPQTLASAQVPEPQGGALVNQFRSQNGRSAIRANAVLMRTARLHAQDMGTAGFMGHVGSDGSSLRDRIRRQGYRGCAYAENVAKGQNSANRAIAFWEASPGHRVNMLNARYTEYGLAGGPGKSWVLVMGQPGC